MQTSKTYILPPPIGGINLRDTETQFPQRGGVPETDAIALTNIFPGQTTADVRGGYEQYTDLGDLAGWSGGTVETLATLIRGGFSYFVAASEGGLANVSTSTASEIVAPATYSEDRWNWENFLDANDALPELLMVNGTDTPIRFDGSTVTNWTFTVTDSSDEEDFIGIVAFKNRLYMWKANSPDFYYGPLGQRPDTSGSNDLTRFPLSGVRGVQGNVVAMEAWTRDAGDGADDYLSIILSAGVVVIYKGTDPASAADWALVGIYQIPPPIDARAVNKFLDDVVIVTESDVVMLSQVIRNQGITGTESKVAPLIKRLAAQFKTTVGWEFTLWPEGTRVYLNIPNSSTTAQQIVFNTRTLSACEYDGWQARTFGAFNGNIYFADSDGVIWLAETGARDNGGEIICDWRTPLLTLGAAGVKTIAGIRPDFSVSDPITYAASVSVDFRTQLPTASVSTGDSTGWVWDSSPTSGPTWDDLKWSGLNDRAPQTTWRIVAGTGEKFSIALQLRLDDIAVTINSMGIGWMPAKNWM